MHQLTILRALTRSAVVVAFVAAASVAQLPKGEAIHVLGDFAVNNLAMVATPPLPLTPSHVRQDTVFAPNTAGCVGSYCFRAFAVDREGFLWVQARSGYVAKLIPPTSGAGPQVVWATNASAYQPLYGVTIDQNGDGLLVGGNGTVLLRVNSLTGATTQEFAFPFPLAVGTACGCGWDRMPRILAHSNGSYYVWGSYGEGWNMYRLRRTGSQYQFQFLRSGRYFAWDETAEGNLILALDTGRLEHVDADTGALLAHAQLPFGAPSEILAVPSPSGTTVWVAGDAFVSRLELDGVGFSQVGVVQTFSYPNISIGLTLDAHGRVWNWGYRNSGGAGGYGTALYFAPTGVSVAGAASISSESAARGDASGLRRAMTVDKYLDEDGDSFSNLAEVRVGANPFDPASTPLARPPVLRVTPSVPIGGSMQLVLGGEASSPFLVCASVRTMAPVSVPGWVGELAIAPPLHVLISTVGFPNQGWLGLPPSGVLSLALSIPMQQGLVGAHLYFQAATITSSTASTGLTNLGDTLILAR